MKRMKISKILLCITAITILAAFAVFSLMVKHSLVTLKGKMPVYKVIDSPVSGNFQRVHFSPGLKVRIRQGKKCQIEIASSDIPPQIQLKDGTLYIDVDSTTNASVLIPVRITMPTLTEIQATGRSEIHLGFFQSDSVHVRLNDGCLFESDNNQLKKIIFQNSGNTKLIFTEMMP